MTILFANPPWWSVDPMPGQPGKGALRRGIRSGSRWPFTMPSAYAPDRFKFGSYLPTPFFLASAASFTARALPAATVVLRDSIARGESYDSFFRAIAGLKPDYMVLETGASSLRHDLALVADLKLLLPKLTVAFAGPNSKSAHDDPKTKSGVVDCWLQGEYEKGAVDFIEGKRGLGDFNLLTREELNLLPFPAYDEEVALNYWDACPKGQEAPHLQVMASRGCVYKCVFCSWPGTMTGDDPDGTKPRSVRHYSIEWIEPFIRDFISRHPSTRSVYFDDDWFNNSKRHVLSVCEMMKRIGLPWTAMCRADTSDKETWQAMKDSGCRGVKVGFESGVQRVVDEIINKRLDIKEAAETCRWLRSIGLSVHGTFTIGLPGETGDEQEATKRFIDELYRTGALDTHQLSGTAIIEGTPLALIEKGESLKKYPGAKIDGNYHSSHDGVAKIQGMIK